MIILFPISSGLEFWSGNHSSIYENSEKQVLKNVRVLGEIANNWANNLLGKNVYKTHES